MDGGKPIRESRDIDIPLAAAHFFHYAGWADKLSYGLAGRDPKPLGVVAQIVPWNFPLLMAAWKLAPALACGNTAILKPAETTPLTALLLAEICQEAELPPGVVSILTGDGADRRRAGARRGHRQGRLHGLDRRRQGHPGRARRPRRRASRSSWAASRPTSCSRTPRIDQAVEGIVQGIFFNQGHVCCAGSRLLVQESVAEAVEAKLWERMQKLRLGDPLDKNTDVGAVNSGEQLERIETLVAAGEEEGAVRRTVACDLPERGHWFAPTLFTEVSPVHRIAVEEIFGPVVSMLTFRTQAEAIEKANNSKLRARRRHLDRQGRQGVRGRRRAAGRRRVAEHLQPLRPDGGLRRLQGERLRARGRRGRAAAVRARMSPRLAVKKTYKLYVGGAFVRSESGRHDPVLDREGRHVANITRASRKDVRDAVKAARKAQPGWAGKTAYNRGPGPLPDGRGARVALGGVRGRGRVGRPAGALRGLDGQAARTCWAA